MYTVEFKIFFWMKNGILDLMYNLHFRSYTSHRSLCTLSICNIGIIISSFQRNVIVEEIKLEWGSVDFSTNIPFVVPYFLSSIILIFIMW